jgi:uncharacterized protein
MARPHRKTNNSLYYEGMSEIILSIVLALALFYGIALAALYWLQGRLVYPLEHIQALKNATLDAHTEAITVRTQDGLNLIARYKAPRDEALPTVILFHGNGEDLNTRAHIALEMIEAGYGVLLAEYRGYAGNPGKPSETGLYADAYAAYAFAAAHTGSIVLHGYSLGSGVAVQLASVAHVDALILEAPFTSIVDVAARRFWLFPVRALARDRYNNIAKIGSVRAPILIYGGTKDRVIPPDHFQQLFDAARGRKELALIEGASHLDVWHMGGNVHVMSFLAALAERRARQKH